MPFIQLYLSPKGRIDRRTFWLRGLIPIYALWNIACLIDFMTRAGGIVACAVIFLSAWPAIAVMIKRWHDRNKSGWYIFVSLIPLVGPFWAFIEAGLSAGTQGDNRFGELSSGSQSTGFTVAILAVIGLIALVWPMIYLYNFPSAPLAAPKIESIAVLPFTNISNEPGHENLADEITGSLIKNLSQMPVKKVISREAVMQHYDPYRQVTEIGRELSADAIIEGTVMARGDRIRINVTLIEVATDTHLWSNNYEGDSQNLPTIVSQMALTILVETRRR